MRLRTSESVPRMPLARDGIWTSGGGATVTRGFFPPSKLQNPHSLVSHQRANMMELTFEPLKNDLLLRAAWGG